MTNWPMAPLGTITDFIRDGTHATVVRRDAGVPLLSAKNVTTDGRVVWDDIDSKISEADYAAIHRHYTIEPDDIVVTIVGSLGRVARVRSSQRIAFQRSVAIIRPGASMDPAFVEHWFRWRTFQRELVRRSNATAQAGVYLGELAEIAIPVPPDAEQRRIAVILDTIDESIRTAELLITKLRSARAGLLRDLMRPGRLDGRRILGDVVTLRGGYGFPEAFQGNESGEIPFFKVSDMNTPGNERFLREANHYVSMRLGSTQGWRLLPPYAVVFAKVGAALLLNRRRLLVGDALVDNNMMGAIGSRAVNPVWLYWWLQTIDFGAFVQPGVLPSVNQAQMASLPISVPPLATQERIAATLDAMDDTINAHSDERQAMLKLQNGLANDLLSGRVRTVPSRHVAEVVDGE